MELPEYNRQPVVVTQHSPYISTHKVKADCTDTVATLTVPFEIEGWKVDSIGIKGRNSSESTDPYISEQLRQDIIKADQNHYAMYLNCTNKNGVHIPADTTIEIVWSWSIRGDPVTKGIFKFKLLYKDICQYSEGKRKDILKWFMMDRSIHLLPGQILDFRVVGYNHNPVNIERVEFRCGFDMFYLEKNLNAKQNKR